MQGVIDLTETYDSIYGFILKIVLSCESALLTHVQKATNPTHTPSLGHNTQGNCLYNVKQCTQRQTKRAILNLKAMVKCPTFTDP